MANHGNSSIRPVSNCGWQPWPLEANQQNWCTNWPNRPPLYTNFQTPYTYRAPPSQYPHPWAYQVGRHCSKNQYNYQWSDKKSRKCAKSWKHAAKPPSAKKSKPASIAQRKSARKDVPEVQQSKLDSSLKESIDCVLHQRDDSSLDKTKSLLNKAEQMCETLRQRRGDGAEDTSRRQDVHMRAKVKGYFKASWPVSTKIKKCNPESGKLISQYAQRSAKSHADKVSMAEHRSPLISAQGRSPRAGMGLKPRPSGARENLMMLVNAPRTPKQRAQITQLLGQYSQMQRQHIARPKLHLEAGSSSGQDRCDDIAYDTVDLNSLPSDVLAQVQQLINDEIDFEDQYAVSTSLHHHSDQLATDSRGGVSDLSNDRYRGNTRVQYASEVNTASQLIDGDLSAAKTDKNHERTEMNNVGCAKKADSSKTANKGKVNTERKQSVLLRKQPHSNEPVQEAASHQRINTKQNGICQERVAKEHGPKIDAACKREPFQKKTDVCNSQKGERGHPGYTVVRSTEKGKKSVNKHYIFDRDDDDDDKNSKIIDSDPVLPRQQNDAAITPTPPPVTRIFDCATNLINHEVNVEKMPSEHISSAALVKERVTVEAAALPVEPLKDVTQEKKKKRKGQSNNSTPAIQMSDCDGDKTSNKDISVNKSQTTRSKNVKSPETLPTVDDSRTTDVTNDNKCEQVTRNTDRRQEETPKRRRSSSMLSVSSTSQSEDYEAKRIKQIDYSTGEDPLQRPDSAGDPRADSTGTPPDSVGTPRPDSVGTPRADSAGTPQPDSVGTPRPDSVGTPQPDSVGTPRPHSVGTSRRDSVGTSRPDFTGTPRPDFAGTPRPDSAEIPRSASAGTPRPDSAGSPRPDSAGTLRPNSAGTPLPDSAGTPTPEVVSAALLQSSTSIVNHVLEISLKEEEILKQLSETNVVIEKLQNKLQKVKDELSACVTARKQLLKRKKQLRRERLTILKENSSNAAVSADAHTNLLTEDVSTDNTCNAIIPSAATVVPTYKQNAACIADSTLIKATVCQNNTGVSTVPCEMPACTEQASDVIVDNVANVQQSGPIVSLPTASHLADAGQCCVQYMGTLQGDGAGQTPLLLKKLAVNLADMQQVSYMFVEENQLALQNLLVARNDQLLPQTKEKKKREPKKPKAATTTTKKKKATVTKRKATVAKKKAATSKKKAPVAKAKTSRAKKVNNSVMSNVASSEFKKPAELQETIAVATSKSIASSARSRAKPKASEFYPGPDAKVHKKLKSKKERDNNAVLQARQSASDTNGEASDEVVTRSSRKKCAETDKCIQQHLHESSSSDVDLDSLTDVPTTCIQNKTPNVTSTVVSAVRTVGKIDNADFISLAPEESKEDLVAMKTEPSDSSLRDWGSFSGHEGPVRCIVIWKNHLLTASEDGTVRRFELFTRKKHACLMVYSGHQQGVSCMHVTTQGSEGTRLFTGGYDGKVIIFNYKTGVQIFTHDYSALVNTMQAAWNILFIGLGDGSIVRYDFQDYSNGSILKCAKTGVTAIAAAKEGVRKLLCVASNDCTITVHDATWGLLVRTLEGHTKPVLTLQFDKHLVYSGGTDKSVLIHDINTATPLRTLRFRAVVTGVSVLGNTLAVASFDGTVRCLDIQTYKLQRIYYGAGKSAVMTMYLTDSVIYTGNQQGMVEGVALTSEQVRCQFGQCDLVFAKRTYLHHHLMQDHVSTLKHNAVCQWKQCKAFLLWRTNMEASTKHLTEHIFNDG